MYAFWQVIVGVFLRRRCVATLTNGCTVKWMRPRKTKVDDYRAMFEGWRAASNRRIKLDSGRSRLMISSSNIVSVEIR